MARRSSRPRPPFGVLAYYGPDTRRATKLVASVFTKTSGKHPAGLERWTVEVGDVRNDRVVAEQVGAWLKGYGVTQTLTEERIIGCPHEEGVDYAMGRVCPQCPFWADIDRFTHEPLARKATMSVEEVLAELGLDHATPPVEALESADAHRDALTQPLLDAVERVLARGADASDEEAQLLSYALYLLAKWREPRACPLVLRWLSLPVDVSDALTGDILTQDGASILAAVYDGNLAAVREVILNRQADQYSRAIAIGGLALLAAWLEVPRTTIVDEFLMLARDGLERERGYVWTALVNRCLDIEALEVFPDLRRAYDDGLVNPREVHPSDVDEVERAPRGVTLAETREREPPIDDVADAIVWWRCFADRTNDEGTARLIADGSEPYRAPPKVGRNEPCPCGSGKKYKRCCGAA